MQFSKLRLLTFQEIYGQAKVTQKRAGLMSRKQVLALQIAFAREEGQCEKCPAVTDLTADHIVPALFLKMLGYNVEREFRMEWYQALCRTCNRNKSHRIEWGDYRTHFILKRVMREQPTWEYTKLAQEHAKLEARFEDPKKEIELIDGPKRLVHVQVREKIKGRTVISYKPKWVAQPALDIRPKVVREAETAGIPAFML